ncbi:MAG: hypothetical protein N2314_08180 [Brevinematales bacterium]|nr:hypothetical protein [Brevinematales bacterium]
MKRHGKWFFLSLIGLAFVTASMDIVLSVNVVGFTVRFSMLVMMVMIGILGVSFLRERRLFLVPGMGWLVLFAFLNMVFALNSSLLSRSFGYAIWLWIYVFWVFCVVQLSAPSDEEKGSEKSFYPHLLVVYMLSFLPALVFGWIQWVVPSLGWIREGLWRTQGTLALFGEYSLYRVNGWNYEPSYYATYLVVLPPLLWVWFRQSQGIQRLWVMLYLVFTMVMIGLSTSRMGWLALGIEGIGIGVGEILGSLQKRWGGKTLRTLGVAGMIMGGLGVVGGIVFLPWQTVLKNTLRWSYTERMEGIQNTLEVVFRHPVFAVSLGGVTPDIALFRGNVVPQGNSDVKPFEGSSVPLEMLSATGVIGGFVLAGLGASLLFFVLGRWRHFSKDQKMWFLVLGCGFFLQMFLLLFNQNILRVYVWNHLAVMMGFLAWSGERRSLDSLELPRKVLSPGVSVYASIFIMTAMVFVFVFQPLGVEIRGGKIKGRFLTPPEYGVVWYDTGRWLKNVEGEPLLDNIRFSERLLLVNENDTYIYTFSSNMVFSQRYIEPQEQSIIWERFSFLKKHTNLSPYLRLPFERLYHELFLRNTLFVFSSEGLKEGLNRLLEDGGFWVQMEPEIHLSALTRAYQKKKETKYFDPIRYHRLLLEDWCVWIPRNPEGHKMGLWLFEFGYPLSLSGKPLEEILQIEQIELDTTWGKIVLPWKPDVWLERDTQEKRLKMRCWFSWSGNRWYIQAHFLRLWWTIATVGVGFVVMGVVWWLITKREGKA